MFEPPSPAEIVRRTLADDTEPETSRLIVAGALVAREGNHFWIVLGGETNEELARYAERRDALTASEPPSSS